MPYLEDETTLVSPGESDKTPPFLTYFFLDGGILTFLKTHPDNGNYRLNTHIYINILDVYVYHI